MLSFSTKGSAKAPQVEKVQTATKIAQETRPDILWMVNYNLMRHLFQGQQL